MAGGAASSGTEPPAPDERGQLRAALAEWGSTGCM